VVSSAVTKAPPKAKIAGNVRSDLSLRSPRGAPVAACDDVEELSNIFSAVVLS
jgi:hypothetical protein